MILPNILITGTPGAGKTEFSKILSIKEKGLHHGRDEEFDCFILDEDKVCDEIEDTIEKGGNIIDFHSCNFFPEKWFQLIIVLTVNNTILYDRLVNRKYNKKKIKENIECEIMQIVLQEAYDSYDKNIIIQLENNNISQLENNIQHIENWFSSWKKENYENQIQ